MINESDGQLANLHIHRVLSPKNSKMEKQVVCHLSRLQCTGRAAGRQQGASERTWGAAAVLGGAAVREAL